MPYAFPPMQAPVLVEQDAPFMHGVWLNDARLGLLQPLLLSSESSAHLKLYEELGRLLNVLPLQC